MSAEAEVMHYAITEISKNKRGLYILNRAVRKANMRTAFFVGVTIATGIIALSEISKSKRRIEALEKELKNEKKRELGFKTAKLLYSERG